MIAEIHRNPQMLLTRFKQSPGFRFFFAPEIQIGILILAVWKFISAARLAIFLGWKPPENLGLRPWSVAAGPSQRFLHRSPPVARRNWGIQLEIGVFSSRFTAVISHVDWWFIPVVTVIFWDGLQTVYKLWIDTMLYTHYLDLRHVLVEEHGFYWQLWEKDKHIQ